MTVQVDARSRHVDDWDGEAREQVDQRDGDAADDLRDLRVGHEARDPDADVLEVDLQAHTTRQETSTEEAECRYLQQGVQRQKLPRAVQGSEGNGRARH